MSPCLREGTVFTRTGLEEAVWESAGLSAVVTLVHHEDKDVGACDDDRTCSAFATARAASCVFGDMYGFASTSDELGVPFGVEDEELQSERRPRVLIGIRVLGRGPGGTCAGSLV